MKGTASDVSNSYPTTVNNYDAAVAAALKRYEKTIVRNHLEDLLKGQRTDNDAKELRGLLDRVVAKKAILTDHGVIWDQLFVRIVESQLSRLLKEKWVRKMCPMIENDEVASFEKLIDFLHSVLAAMEVLSSDKISKNKMKSFNQSSHSKHSIKKESHWPTSAAALLAQAANFKCLFCSENHELPKCSKFLDLHPAQRLAELVCQPGKVCFKCLKFKDDSSHPTTFKKCNSKCGVRGCSKAHHTLFHVDTLPPPKKVNNTVVSTVRCFTPIPSHLKEESKFSGNEIETILPTASAKIKVDKKEKIIRVGFDSFSQKTFLTKEIADELKIPVIRTEFLNIGGFGGISATELMGIVKFALSPLNRSSQEKIHVEAHLKKGKICSPLDPLDFKLNDVPHLQNLILADMIQRSDAQIDLLLGSRYYFLNY